MSSWLRDNEIINKLIGVCKFAALGIAILQESKGNECRIFYILKAQMSP